MDLVLLFWASLTFLVFLALLIKASDYFTGAAEELGLYLGISPLIIGLSIVALGTSLPELVTSINATLNNRSAIVAGNVIGSNITNILLVFGCTVVFANLAKIKIDLADKRFFGISAILTSLVILGGVVSFWEGIICLFLFVAYIIYYARLHTDNYKKLHSQRPKFKWVSLAVLIIAPYLIHLGAKWAIVAIVVIAKEINVGQEIIACTVIALGTSLPELSVSIVAARKGSAQLAVGNIIGSNIINSSLVLGLSSIIGPTIIKASIIYISLPFMWLSSILLVLIIAKNKISNWWGVLLFALYISFIIISFMIKI